MPETIIESVLTGKLDAALLIKWLNDESLEDTPEDCILNCCNRNEFVTCFLSFLRNQTDSILQTNSNAVQILQHSTPEKLLSTRRKHRRSISDPTSEDRTMDSLSVKIDRQRSHESPSKDRKRTGRRVKTKLFTEAEKSVNQSASSDESRLSTGVDRLVLSSTPLKNGVKPSDYPNLPLSSPVTPRSFVKENYERCDTPRLSHRHSKSSEKSCLGDYMQFEEDYMVASEKLKEGDMEYLMKTIHNSTYFAVKSLWHQRVILEVILDKSSLKTLGENKKVRSFYPDLAKFLLNCYGLRCENESTLERTRQTEPRSHGVVCFNSETDNIDNFPSMMSFQSFKKQRDMFYEIWRWYQDAGAGGAPRSSLRARVKALISSGASPSNHAHLANLFTSHMVQHCLPSTKQESKLSKLQRRLTCPNAPESHRLPQFTPQEMFYKEFIINAENESFRVHLRDAIASEIVTLDGTHIAPDERGNSNPELTKEYLALSKKLALLAKFLGLIASLPYTQVATDSSNKNAITKAVPKEVSYAAPKEKVLENDLVLRNYSQPPIDLKGILTNAQENGRLSFTIPWIVHYLSMLDYTSLRIKYYQNLLKILFDIYTNRLKIEKSTMKKNTTIYLKSILGWLFDLPHFPQELFHENRLCVSAGTDMNIDSCDLIDESVIIELCPHLRDLNVLLSTCRVSQEQKDIGSYRHITPVSLTLNPEDRIKNKEKELQTRLEEELLKSQPSSTRRVLELVIERVTSACVRELSGHTLNAQRTKARNHVARLLANTQMDQPSSTRRVLELVIERVTSACVRELSGHTLNAQRTKARNHVARLLANTQMDQPSSTRRVLELVIERVTSACVRELSGHTLNAQRTKARNHVARLLANTQMDQPSSTRRVLELVIERVTSACVRELSGHTLNAQRTKARNHVARLLANTQMDQASLLAAVQQIYSEHLQQLRSVALEAGRASIQARAAAAVCALLASAPAPLVTLVVRAAVTRLAKWLSDNWNTTAVLCKDIEGEMKTLLALGELGPAVCHSTASDVTAMTSAAPQFAAQHVSAAASVINLKEQVCLLLEGSETPTLTRVLSTCAIACSPHNIFIRPPTQKAILQLSVDLCVVFVSRKPKEVNESFLAKLHAIWNVCCPDRKRSPPQEITLPERREELSPTFRNFEDDERIPTPVSDDEIPTKIIIVNQIPEEKSVPTPAKSVSTSAKSVSTEAMDKSVVESEDSDVNLEFFDRILCPRNIMLLSDGKSVDVWEAMATVLVFLLTHDYLSEDSLTEQCLAVYRQDWSQNILESLSTCMKSVSARWSRSSTGKFTLFLDFLAEFCGDMDYEPLE
ncbi:hypothetical protein PYW07_011275 [Mythimna separata]|uniref:Codanin-1 C-terminal domain-containing protein n=1 Tax=Mythimna separata TaxID=271217 RepID=A0AAD7Y999_MYTSE|nr:hypothetical protein PYW07_011275 [Mythimna separata]